VIDTKIPSTHPKKPANHAIMGDPTPEMTAEPVNNDRTQQNPKFGANKIPQTTKPDPHHTQKTHPLDTPTEGRVKR
jgi:hypothetical protein